MKINISREEWLIKAANKIEKQILSEQQISLPEFWKVGVGFPSSARAIGQAWDCKAAQDEKTHHIFISPILGNHDKVNLLQVLLHEMIHIAVGIDQKHRGEFKRVARAVGLEGRLTATYVSSDSPLATKLLIVYSEVAKDFGDYPHETIVLKPKEKKERASNIIKVVSQANPDYILKIKKDVVEKHGLPCDPWGEQMMFLESEGD